MQVVRRREIDGGRRGAPSDHRARLGALLLWLAVVGGAAVLAPRSAAADEAGAAPSEAATPAGRWIGAIEVPGSPLGIEVTLRAPEAEAAAGTPEAAWRGTITIATQNLREVPLGDVTVDGRSAIFRIPGIPGDPTFYATLDEAGTTLGGGFTQGGGRLTFSLQRADVAARAAAEKLAGLDAEIEAGLVRFGVPGLALGVVKDGEVLVARGYGWRDAERRLPVTPRTQFAIGSSTKAFTTFVLATLADEGAFDFSRPVREYLPAFRLAEEDVAARVTTLDAVTHRTGLPRHDIVWYDNPALTTATVLDHLPHLALNKGLRETFQYNNLMFVLAGRVAEEVGGATWEELVRARVFVPLGMAASGFSVAEAHAGEDVALTYAPDDPEEEDGAEEAEAAPGDDATTEEAEASGGAKAEAPTYHRIPYRDIRNVGPAGGIMSNVEDMLRWAELHLGDGTFEGERVISEGMLRFLHEPVTVMGGPGTPHASLGAYAPGWMVDMYRGRNRVQHGGAIDGYICEVVLFPDDGLGIVVFANLSATGLPSLVARHVADRVLGLERRDWIGESAGRLEQMEEAGRAAKKDDATRRVEGTSPSHALADYAGDFAHPGYGTVKVTHVAAGEGEGDGHLEMELHGMRARLEHWHYDVFRAEGVDLADEVLDDTQLQFRTSLDGEIVAFEAVVEPSVAAVTFGRAAEASLADPAVLRGLAGAYAIGPQRMTFSVRGGELVLDIVGQPRYVLEPRRDWTFALRELEGFAVRFAVDEEGRATAATFLQPNGVFEARRVEAE